jgi:hypothetical protein
MISLRQHIFSLVAVFVALAVGIAAGSTVVRGPLLDSTRARLESAEVNIAEERAENDRLAAEIAQLDGWAVDGPAQLLGGILADRAVMLLVAGDVDADAVVGTIRSIRTSSAVFVGEVRIDPTVFDPALADRIVEVLGAAEVADREPAAVFGDEVAARLRSMVDRVRGASGPLQSDALVRGAFGDLEDAGLVDVLGVTSEDFSTDDVAVIVLSDRNLANDPAAVLDRVIAIAAPDAEGGPIVTTVAEVGRVLQDNETPVPAFVASIRNSGRLRDEVSTVDNAETFLGWAAAVLAVRSTIAGTVGHYGFREGAERSIPAATP